MSWNFRIYKTDHTGEQMKPLGDLDRVTDALNASFIALEWQSRTTAALPVDDGFRVNLAMQGRMVQDVYIDGGFNHLREFAGLCKREGWKMASPRTGDEVDLRDPQKWLQERSPTSEAAVSAGTFFRAERQSPGSARNRSVTWLMWVLCLIGVGLLVFFLWRANT